jgi:aminomethyltransferase
MGLKTVLFDAHVEMGARIVPFGGWDMPLHYGSQLEEHHAVRQDAGMFDVSHMLVIDLQGERCREFLQRLLANDVARLQQPAKALYSCMLNERGGVIDDLIVYFLAPDRYRMVVNAATADKDLAWIEEQASIFALNITARRDLAMIAVQGPNAREGCIPYLGEALRQAAGELKRFAALEGDGWLLARTGYTGEDGFEIMLPAEQVGELWQGLAAAAIKPCGLGARDTLRLEAGLNLYGSDMDEQTTPLESGLEWTVAWEPEERDFIGREALVQQRDKADNQRLVGLVLLERGVLRNHQQLFVDEVAVGEITSGGFAPTLERSIALARVHGELGDHCEVEIRGKRVPVRVVQPPFVRDGAAVIDVA